MTKEIRAVSIPEDRKFVFPSNIAIVRYASRILVISVETANWLIFNNEEQLAFFELLGSYTLKEALSRNPGTPKDAEHVVTQIIARDFESLDIQYKQDMSSLHIYLTNACNMRCPHCYMSAGLKAENELSEEEILTLLSQAQKNDINHVIFSGGEATLHPSFSRFIDYAHKLEMTVELLTNGTLLSEELIGPIATKLSRVQVSIDGYSEETNAPIRGKGNFAKALNAVDILVKHNINTDIAITAPYSPTLHLDIKHYIAFAQDLLARYNNNIVIAFTGMLFDGRSVNLSAKEQAYYEQCINQISTEVFGPKMKESGFIEFHRLHGVDDNCAYGNLSIASNGDIYFCSQISPLKPIGNLRTMTYEKIFAESKKAKARANINNVNPCRHCDLKYICGGDCRIMYYPELLDPHSEELPVRKCSQKVKEEVYELMIRTHEDMFQ